VLDLSLHKMPIKDFGHYSISLGYPELYYKIGDINKARQTAEILIDIFQQQIEHYSTYDDISYIGEELETTAFMYQNILAQIRQFDDREYSSSIESQFDKKLSLLNHLIEIPDQTRSELEMQMLDSIETANSNKALDSIESILDSTKK